MTNVFDHEAAARAHVEVFESEPCDEWYAACEILREIAELRGWVRDASFHTPEYPVWISGQGIRASVIQGPDPDEGELPIWAIKAVVLIPRTSWSLEVTYNEEAPITFALTLDDVVELAAHRLETLGQLPDEPDGDLA